MLQKEVLVIMSIQLRALSIKKEVANLGISVRSSIPKRLEANQRSDIILCPIAKTLDIIQAGKEITLPKFKAKGDFLHGVSRKLCRVLLERTWNFFARKPGTCICCNKVKETFLQACEKSSDHRAKQLKRKLSHLGQLVTMKIESLRAAAHLSA